MIDNWARKLVIQIVMGKRVGQFYYIIEIRNWFFLILELVFPNSGSSLSVRDIRYLEYGD